MLDSPLISVEVQQNWEEEYLYLYLLTYNGLKKSLSTILPCSFFLGTHDAKVIIKIVGSWQEETSSGKSWNHEMKVE